MMFVSLVRFPIFIPGQNSFEIDDAGHVILVL